MFMFVHDFLIGACKYPIASKSEILFVCHVIPDTPHANAKNHCEDINGKASLKIQAFHSSVPSIPHSWNPSW